VDRATAPRSIAAVRFRIRFLFIDAIGNSHATLEAGKSLTFRAAALQQSQSRSAATPALMCAAPSSDLYCRD
jgi:hypothetical protein